MQTVSDEQGIAERYDWVIDFSRYNIGDKVWMVNVAEHVNGKKPAGDLTIAQALSGTSLDPCVGKFLEFRIVRNPAQPDVSQVPNVMIPNPDLSSIPVSRERTFTFGSGASQPLSPDDPAAFTTGAGGQKGPWGVITDKGQMLNASFGRVSAAPGYGTREVWTLQNGGGGWDHPIHIHFEEGQILARNGKASNVPAWEKGRKDVYRLRPGGSVHAHDAVPRLGRDVHGALPQHRARGQRHARSVGDRQRRRAVPAAAADADRNPTGCHLRGAGRHRSDCVLKQAGFSKKNQAGGPQRKMRAAAA